jgi:hypothetical protein
LEVCGTPAPLSLPLSSGAAQVIRAMVLAVRQPTFGRPEWALALVQIFQQMILRFGQM